MKHRLQTMGIAIVSLLLFTWIVPGCQFYLEAQNSEVSKFWGGTVTVALFLSVYGLIQVLERWK